MADHNQNANLDQLQDFCSPIEDAVLDGLSQTAASLSNREAKALVRPFFIFRQTSR